MKYIILSIILTFSIPAVAGIDYDKLMSKEPSSSVDKKILSIDKLPDVNVNISAPVNKYLLMLPFVTIAIVFGSTIVTIYTLNKNSKETKSAFSESLENQRDISRSEVKANVLSTSRQQWINSLRDELSEFISILHHVQVYVDTDNKKGVTKEFIDVLIKSQLKASKIYLLINPKEDDHIELVNLIKEALEIIGKGHEEAFNISEKIVSLSQKILKDEWNVLKSLK